MALITLTQDEITTRVHEAYLALSGKKFDEEDLKEFIIDGKKANDEKKIHYMNPYQLFLKSYYGTAKDLHIFPDEKNKSIKAASEIWKKLQEYNYENDEKDGFSYFQKKSESYKERCIYGSEELGYKGDELKEWVEKELWPLGQTEDEVFEDIDDYFESFIRITNIVSASIKGIPIKAIKLDNDNEVCCIRNKTLSEKEDDYYQKEQNLKINYVVDVDDIEGKKIEERIEKQLNYMIAHPGAESTPYD